MSLAGKTIVITGTLSKTRKEIAQDIRAAGGKVGSSISRNTDVLVAGPGCGAKLNKAVNLGVTIWKEAELYKHIGDDDDEEEEEELDDLFDGMRFVIAAPRGAKTTKLKSAIVDHGGTVLTRAPAFDRKNTLFFVADPSYSVPKGKVAQASKLKKPWLDSAFVFHAVSNGKLESVDDHVIDDDEEEEEEEDESEDMDEEEEESSSSSEDDQPATKKARGTPMIKVDDRCPLGASGATVYNGMAAKLNQTNIKNNNNKFYVVQLLNHPTGFYCYTRWGRVGEPGMNKNAGPWSLERAEKEFRKKFRDKTKNNWDDRDNFVKYAGKYDLLEMNHEEQTEDVYRTALANMDGDSGTKTVTKYKKSELDAPLQKLITLLFDVDMFKSAMKEYDIDVKKLPLGALSQSQLDKGFAQLKVISRIIKGKTSGSLEEEWSTFYTIIPHSFGRRRPPIHRDQESVQKKKDMLNVLSDIELAQKLTKKKKGTKRKKETKEVILENPLDSKYDLLQADLETLDHSSEEFEILHRYMKQTQATWRKFELLEIFKVNRHGEEKRFAQHDDIENRRLLWHGTNVAVVVAILKTGLRIMPHSGGRVGKGIYFASEHAKSASYVRPQKGVGIMFLTEVALGKEKHIGRDDCTLKKAPNGYDSIVAKGHTEPDPKKDCEIEIDGHSVTVPQGKPVKQAKWNHSSFSHSEYLIYKESQHRIRYLLKIKW